MFERFSEESISAILSAQEEARACGYKRVGTETILLGIVGLSNHPIAKAFKRVGVDFKSVKKAMLSIAPPDGRNIHMTDIPFTPRARALLEAAFNEAVNRGADLVDLNHIAIALLKEGGMAIKILDSLNINKDELYRLIEDSDAELELAGTASGPSREIKGSYISEFCTDLTKKAQEGKVDPLIGRDKDLDRVIQILGRRTKNNPVLVGLPGVGKTSIVEGLALRISEGDIPEDLRDKKVLSLDLGLLISGTKFRGEFEQRLNGLISEISQNNGQVILSIDEVHTVIGAGASEGSTDASNILKPALARGQLQCIGATTLDEYKKYIERDAALERRFQLVMVDEPSVEDTIDILEGIRNKYERHHRLTISDEAIHAAAIMSARYISDRYLPDKAIDLIDEAASRIRIDHSIKYKNSLDKDTKLKLKDIYKNKNIAVDTQDFTQASQLIDEENNIKYNSQLIEPKPISKEDIAKVVGAWTNIPVSKLTQSESDIFLNLEDKLHEKVIGQDDAVKALSNALKRTKAGLKNPKRPIGNFLFSGPTGSGKTHLAKCLAEIVFGSDKALIRIDMSEYMDRHTTSKLIGSPPGFIGYEEGGQLTERVRRKPYSVILFDEVEKAHPDIFNTLLQVLDVGILTDSQGRKVSFRNCIIIMTSNIGSSIIQKGGSVVGFDIGDNPYDNIRSMINEELKNFFRPEFINRIDEIIVFNHLNKKEVNSVADILLEDVYKRLRDNYNIELELTNAFRQKLLEEGYDKEYGARPMRRSIVRLLEDSLADAILDGRLSNNSKAVVDLSKDGVVNIDV